MLDQTVSVATAHLIDPSPTPPPGDFVQLEIVIPALNEARRIGATLREVSAHLARLPFTCMITVVDNGSADATADVVKEWDNPLVPIRLIGCSRRGKGAAVKAGILRSTAAWVGFCDADLATPISALDSVLPLLAGGAPVVIGSRRCGGASYVTAQPRVRRVGSWAFRRLTRSLAGDFSDTQCGFKFFDHAAAQRIFAEVTAAGFTFDLDVMAAAKRLDLAVSEIPVEWSDQAGSTLRPLEHGREVLREVRVLRKMSDSAQSHRRPVADRA